MKNLMAELLIKLAEKEEVARELSVQVAAMEIVVTAMLRHMTQDAQQTLITDVESALDEISPGPQVDTQDMERLQEYIKKLLRHPRS